MEISEQKLKEFGSMLKQDHPDLELNREQLLDLAEKTIRIIELLYSDDSNLEL